MPTHRHSLALPKLPLVAAMALATAAIALGATLPGAAGAATGGLSAVDGNPTAVASSSQGGSSSGTISGTVPLRGMNVQLMAARPGDRLPVRLGSARSGAGGAFAVRYQGARPGQVTYLLATRPGGAAEAGYPIYGQSYRLAAALGEGTIPVG